MSDEGVAYVDPIRKARTISLAMEDIRSARYEEKKFGITGRKKEMCAVIAVTGGKKLTLTERFLTPDILQELVEDVSGLIQEQEIATPGQETPGPAEETGSLEEAGNAESPPRAEEPAEEGPPGEKGGSCDG